LTEKSNIILLYLFDLLGISEARNSQYKFEGELKEGEYWNGISKLYLLILVMSA